MKTKLLPIVLLFCFMFTAIHGQTVKLAFADRAINNDSLCKKMETDLTKLLSEINRANSENRKLNYDGIDIDKIAARNLSNMWKIIPFSIDDTDLHLRCLCQETGYQIREISITLNSHDPSLEESLTRELSVSFTKKGAISGVRLALNPNIIGTFLHGESTDDNKRRLEMLTFIESYRNYFIEKNIEALEKIYGDDALIITGTAIKQKAMNNIETDRVIYYHNKERGKQYILNRLRKQILTGNRNILVDFDHISVERCGMPGKTNFYGVSLHQICSNIKHSTSNDSYTSIRPDEGWLFMLWEFPEDEGVPIIHALCWQPDETILNKDSIITLHDFKL